MHPTQNPATTDTRADGWSPADTLRAVAVYHERHGWTRDTMFDRAVGTPTPPACVIGGVQLVVLGRAVDVITCGYRNCDNGDARTIRAAVAVLADHIGVFNTHIDPADAVAEWNDQPGRTVTDVIHTCRAAADAYDRIGLDGGAA